MPGDGLTHGPPATKKQASVTTRSAGSTGIPCAMVLTVSFVLSPGTGLSCPRHRRDAKHHHQLSASVGAPGPHDFAVHVKRRSSAQTDRARHFRVHRIPHPTSVTTAIRPSDG